MIGQPEEARAEVRTMSSENSQTSSVGVERDPSDPGSGLNSLDLWDYTVELECLQGSQDLQLAAELGKTLLERNKELETTLKHHQNVIEDQAQEIEYLTKQTIALKEVNDSRLRIYEQLEVSIQDLERANHRLASDHAADKKQIKSLTGTIEGLETKCEEFQKNVDDLTAQLDIYKRRAERQSEQLNERCQKREQSTTESQEDKTRRSRDGSKQVQPNQQNRQTSNHDEDDDLKNDEILRLSNELGESKSLHIKQERRIGDLEEQLAAMVQENNKLHERTKELSAAGRSDEMMKSMHEEFAILEEVRQGQLCGRCLRNIEQATDDMSSIMDAEEDDDDRSVLSSLLNEPQAGGPHKLVQIQGQKEVQLWPNPNQMGNPYRDLVEKYEALLEVQRNQANVRKPKPTSLHSSSLNNSAPLSLQEELQMSGDFSQFSIKDTDEESGHGDELNKSTGNAKTGSTMSGPTNRKSFTRTPDFSEAETSSSGFSDETSNKATQTDRERPGSFLCTIADGEDCRFSIYDDDNRFRNRPEYRELFKEIFGILRKAAENKDEGEKLPLLTEEKNKPAEYAANEDLQGDYTDETQSIMSSVMSEQSIPMSDAPPPTLPSQSFKGKENVPSIAQECHAADPKDQKSPQDNTGEPAPPRVLTPLLRQPLDFMTASPQFRKRSTRHKNRKNHSQDRQGAESPIIPTPPKICYQRGPGRKTRRDYRPLEPSPLTRPPNVPSNAHNNAMPEWNGATMQFYNRSLNSPTPSHNGAAKNVSYQKWNPETDSWVIKQSTASQDLHKLRRLEMSYAEVLRNADKNKGRRRRHHQ